jgi:3-dehydroquinate dehydratase-2
MSGLRVMVLHGVNLDQLGRRDPEHYGGGSLTDLEGQVSAFAGELGDRVVFEQTNFEGEYVELLHKARERGDALILNPGAWTHYAWAIHDALELSGLPAVEVHLSDVKSRDGWRQTSVISDLCIGTISGKGAQGYREALLMLADHAASVRAAAAQEESA